jgi:hypothetical protein
MLQRYLVSVPAPKINWCANPENTMMKVRLTKVAQIRRALVVWLWLAEPRNSAKAGGGKSFGDLHPGRGMIARFVPAANHTIDACADQPRRK